MVLNDQFKFEVNPVQGVDIHQEFEVAGQKYTIAQLREALPMQEKRFTCVIDWDDMCQYTAIGLHEVLKANYDKSKEFDLVDFLSRRDYPNGIDYVKKILYPNIPAKTINTVYRNRYVEICQMSPMTEFFSRMFLAKLVYQSMTFVFPFEVPGLKDMMADIQREIFTNKVECDYIILPTESDKKEFYKLGSHDIYVISNAGLCYEALLEKDRKDKVIITPDNHHGISEVILGMYLLFVEANEIKGPNNITLQLLTELNEYNETDDKSDLNTILFENNGGLK